MALTNNVSTNARLRSKCHAWLRRCILIQAGTRRPGPRGRLNKKKGGSKVRINWKKYQSHLLSIFGVETSTFEQPFQSVAGGIGSSDENVVGGMRKAITIILGCFELEHVSFRRGDVSAEEL